MNRKAKRTRHVKRKRRQFGRSSWLLAGAVIFFAVWSALAAPLAAESGSGVAAEEKREADSQRAEETSAGGTESSAPAAESTAAAEEDLVVPVEGVYRQPPGPKPDRMSTPVTPRREDFNRSNQTLIEILEGIPGVEVQELGGSEGPWRLMIRGNDPKAAAVYLDGILISDPTGAVPDLSRIPLGLVEEVMVYRGSVPAGYPESGTAGIVDIRTLGPGMNRRAQVRISHDSRSRTELSAGAAGEVLGSALMVGAHSEWGPGRFSYPDDRGTPADSSDDRNAERKNNAFADHDVIVKWERKVERYRFYGGAYYQYNEHELPGEGRREVKSASLTHDRILAYAGVNRPAALGADLDLELRLHGLWERRWLEDEKGEVGPPRDEQHTSTRFGLDSYLNYYGINQNLIVLYFGFYEYDWQPESEIDPEVDDLRARRSSVYFHAAGEIRLLENRLTIKPRLRHLWIENKYDGLSLSAQAGEAPSTSHFSTTNVDVSLHLLLAQNLWLSAAAGQYYRPPDFLEEFGDRTTWMGNADLKPERNETWEIGLHYDIGPVLEIDVFHAELTYYQSRVHNRIGWLEAGAGQYQAATTGDALLRGVELGVHLNVRDRLLIDAAYTWQETDNLSDDPLLRHNQLPGRAVNSASLAATLYQSYGRIYYKAYYQDSRWLDEENTISADPRLIHNLGIGYYRGRWTVGLEAINLGNDQSREVLGWPLPGTRYQMILEYQM